MTTKSAPFFHQHHQQVLHLKKRALPRASGCNNDHHHCVSNEWSFVEHGWVPHIVPSFCGICSVVAARTGEEEGREAQEVLDPLATKKSLYIAFTSPPHSFSPSPKDLKPHSHAFSPSSLFQEIPFSTSRFASHSCAQQQAL